MSMDPSLLQQFRQQLASWIETRLVSQRLPFQRLELCPRTLTDLGRLTPDLVLWINRDSQLAGSMILLPDVVDDQVLAEGVALAQALGLGHFTTWAAREVSIWTVLTEKANLLESFDLPPANRITPDDFQETLNDLLERLKVITVTSAPLTTSYSEHYFANLCLRNLNELTPGLTASARMTAGKTAADDWVEQAPREKAWMCLWRMLFLLQEKRLPPGLQPDRLEFAIQYALTDLIKDQQPWLAIQESEPPLPEEDAVRLHHLAGRLRQLGWPNSRQHAQDMVGLLLNEAAHRFELSTPQLPWFTEQAQLHVNCHPNNSPKRCSLVAPRAYLAGWAFKMSLSANEEHGSYAESLQTLDRAQKWSNALAILQEQQPLDRKERDERLILLRQVWPSRRFDLPKNTPAWLWDALYLVGLVSEELSLVMPSDWHRAQGIQTLWGLLTERYQLSEIAIDSQGEQACRFVSFTQEVKEIKIHRESVCVEIPYQKNSSPKPGTTQIYLKADKSLLEILIDQKLAATLPVLTSGPEPLSWGAYVFLRTQLGHYLWNLCSDHEALPELESVAEAITIVGMPLPDENTLSDLCLVGLPETGLIPEPEILEREFTNIFGSTAEIPIEAAQTRESTSKPRRRGTISSKEIADKVFEDGLPRFPEHYMMHLYRPELNHYELKGQLRIAEEFFDKISLKTSDGDQTIEVSGRMIAEALVLASYMDQKEIGLPNDEQILTEVLQQYRSDLKKLHHNLMKECRRLEPQRQAAIKLAGRIWQQQGLPPESIFKQK